MPLFKNNFKHKNENALVKKKKKKLVIFQCIYDFTSNHQDFSVEQMKDTCMHSPEKPQALVRWENSQAHFSLLGSSQRVKLNKVGAFYFLCPSPGK